MSVLFNESISNSEWVDINTLTSTVIGTPIEDSELREFLG